MAEEKASDKKLGGKPNRKGKSFALQHWEAFEALSMQIISDIYKEKPGKLARLTSRQNDGGYDGILCFPAHPDHASTLYKVLLEAKLRSSSRHDLPLSDFSKTIIIAVNTVADKIYISTNAYFSVETIRRLKLYSNRTGLEIRTVDIQSIVGWLNTHPKEVEQVRDKELLRALAEMDHPLRTEQRELASEEVLQEKCTQTPKLFSDSRNRQLFELCEVMSRRNGVLCIRGVMGSGKTAFIQNMAFNLQGSYPNIAQLDLTNFSDAQSVFIKLLSIAWGETTNNIYAMSEKDLKDVTEYLGDQQFPQRSRAALINMIRQTQHQFNENTDLHSELLLDFLREIIPPVIRRVRVLLFVTNIKNATQNALDFLCSFIKILPEQPISFLVELEEQEDNCEYFLSELRQARSFLDAVALSPWDDAAARRFLTEKISWLSETNKSDLIHYFGLLPLALSAGAEALRLSNVGQVLQLIGPDGPSIPLAQPQYTLGCVDYIVSRSAIAGGPEVQCGFVLLGLFDGAAELALLEETASALALPSPIPFLSMCPFLKQLRGEIRVLHGAYVNSLGKLNFISNSFLYMVLSHVEPTLENYFFDSEYVMRKRFKIFSLCRNFERIDNIWMSLAASHMLQGERQLTYQVLKVVYAWWVEDTTTNRLEPYRQYWLLFHLSEAAFVLYGANVQELQRYIEQLNAVMQLSAEEIWPGGPEAFRQNKAEILHMRSQIALGQADYQQMLSYAGEGITLLLEGEPPKDRNCLGNLWADKSLAIKHLQNIAACIQFLESGKERLMGVAPFMYCYYTHLSSLYSVGTPRTALMYFEKIKCECDCSLSQELHNNHNIATMHFVLGEYDLAAQISGRTWSRAYENLISIEEGRSDHLLGCIEWIRSNGESAFERFLAAYQTFRTHLHHTHLWPPLVNLSTLCIELGRADQALHYTRMAVELLLEYHIDSINHLNLCSDGLPKIFVGVLLLLDHLCRLDETDIAKKNLLEQITLPEVHRAYADYVCPDQLDKLLEGSGYLCGGKRMLKV